MLYIYTNAEKPFDEKTADVKAIGEKARAIETTVEKTAESEEPNTPLAVQVEGVSKDKSEEECVAIIDDEFCSNDVYSQGKPSHTPSSRVSGAAPSTSRKPAFDYWTLSYDDSD